MHFMFLINTNVLISEIGDFLKMQICKLLNRRKTRNNFHITATNKKELVPKFMLDLHEVYSTARREVSMSHA